MLHVPLTVFVMHLLCAALRACMQAFEDTYKREFGFVLEERNIIVDDLRVRATGKVPIAQHQL